MAQDPSFDIVSKIERPELQNAVAQAMTEIQTRFDFKGSNSSIELDQKENKFLLASSDEYKIKALYDVLQTRLSKRGVPLRNIIPEKIESGLSGTAKQTVKKQ